MNKDIEQLENEYQTISIRLRGKEEEVNLKVSECEKLFYRKQEIAIKIAEMRQ